MPRACVATMAFFPSAYPPKMSDDATLQESCSRFEVSLTILLLVIDVLAYLQCVLVPALALPSRYLYMEQLATLLGLPIMTDFKALIYAMYFSLLLLVIQILVLQQRTSFSCCPSRAFFVWVIFASSFSIISLLCVGYFWDIGAAIWLYLLFHEEGISLAGGDGVAVGAEADG